MTPIKLGKFLLYPLLDGFFALDGGAMFGIVPKVLWSRSHSSDEKNRIKLAMRPLLVEAGGKWILIDTGAGDKFDSKNNEIYALHQSGLKEQLQTIGIQADDISVVINTHLHWDHAGGNTVHDGTRWAPAFPNARYIVQRGEYEFATHLNERIKGSYRVDDYESLFQQGYFDFADGDQQILPGVRVVRSGGHVPYHQCVWLESDQNTAFFLGDLIPTHTHLALPYIMGFDLDPLTTLEKKREYLSQAANEDWLLFFVHDPNEFAGKVENADGSFRFKKMES